MNLGILRISDHLKNSFEVVGVLLAAVIAALININPAVNLATAVILVLLVAVVLIYPIAAFPVLLIIAPLRTLIATESIINLPLDIGQITLALLLITYLISRVAQHKSLKLKFSTPLTTSFILFLGITGLSALNAISFSGWLAEWLKWLQMFVIISVITTWIRARDWKWLIFGLALAGVANSLIGIYEFLGGSGALHLLINNRFFRAFGTFGQPNPFGGFMGLVIPIALMLMLSYFSRLWIRRKYDLPWLTSDWLWFAFWGSATLLLLIGIFVSWSRGAWLGLAGSIATMALIYPRNIRYGMVAFLIISIFAATLWFSGLLPASIVERLSTSTQEFFTVEDVRGVDITPDNYAVVERLAHWNAAINMATYAPWFGIGFGNYEVVYDQYRLINWPEPLGHAHNYYLNLLAEVGIIGLLGYGKVWQKIMHISLRASRHPDQLARFAAIGLFGSWTYLSIHSFFDNLYVNNLFIHLGVMLGVLILIYNQLDHFEFRESP